MVILKILTINISRINKALTFFPVGEEDILKSLQSLSVSKATGLDGLSAIGFSRLDQIKYLLQ